MKRFKMKDIKDHMVYRCNACFKELGRPEFGKRVWPPDEDMKCDCEWTQKYPDECHILLMYDDEEVSPRTPFKEK